MGVRVDVKIGSDVADYSLAGPESRQCRAIAARTHSGRTSPGDAATLRWFRIRPCGTRGTTWRGGVRVLRALGLPIDVYHFNEGHALACELLREEMEDGHSFDQHRACTEQTIFATHTPVPAGNEVHPLQLLFDVGANVDTLSWEQLKQIGGDPFQRHRRRCASAGKRMQLSNTR